MKKLYFLPLRLYRFTPPPTLTAYTIDPTSQLLPGLHSDEPYNALGGWRILHTGQWSPDSDIDQGRSVAHRTLTAAIIALVGPLAESARITSLIARLISLAGMVWQPIGSTTDDWVIATYLSDANGQIRTRDDRQLCDGSYPTSRWQNSDLISDDRTLTLPEDLPAATINSPSYSTGSAMAHVCPYAALPVKHAVMS